MSFEKLMQPTRAGPADHEIPHFQNPGPPSDVNATLRRDELRRMAMEWALVCCGESKDYQLVIRAARDFLAFLQE